MIVNRDWLFYCGHVLDDSEQGLVILLWPCIG